MGSDDVEFELMDRVIKDDMPFLGICRGCHVLNIACGGSLYADVQQEKGTFLKHVSSDPGTYDTYRHRIRIHEGTPLAKWYEKDEIKANSYHHQGIKVLAPGLAPMAFSDDGLVEGCYDPERKYRLGLQFHPERLLSEEPKGVRIYEEFVRAAKEYQKDSN